MKVNGLRLVTVAVFWLILVAIGSPGLSTSEGNHQPQAQAIEVHGNVKSRIYHLPGCRYYDCKNCTAVFPTREAAEAAGYRMGKGCPR